MVDGLIPESLYSDLCSAADAVTDLARRHQWSQVRVVGKQFPPWTAGDDVWGVQNLMHPQLHQPVFSKWYGSDDMLAVSAALMHCSKEEMQFGEFPPDKCS